MSDNGRYRKLYPRLWRHPGFNKLTKSARELTLYLLCGPQTNRLGLFYLSVATAAEDLNASVETIRKGLADIAVTFGWTFDARARVFYIPSWWRWNPPENINVIRGSLKDLNEIPPCSLVEAFALNIETLPDAKDKEGRTLRGTFIECLPQHLPERPPNQDQEQKHFQEAEAGAPRFRAKKRAEKEKLTSPPNNKLLTIAREALKFTRTDSPFEELVDVFYSVAGQKGLSPSTNRADAVAAINVALSERRTA